MNRNLLKATPSIVYAQKGPEKVLVFDQVDAQNELGSIFQERTSGGCWCVVILLCSRIGKGMLNTQYTTNNTFSLFIMKHALDCNGSFI